MKDKLKQWMETLKNEQIWEDVWTAFALVILMIIISILLLNLMR